MNKTAEQIADQVLTKLASYTFSEDELREVAQDVARRNLKNKSMRAGAGGGGLAGGGLMAAMTALRGGGPVKTLSHGSLGLLAGALGGGLGGVLGAKLKEGSPEEKKKVDAYIADTQRQGLSANQATNNLLGFSGPRLLG